MNIVTYVSLWDKRDIFGLFIGLYQKRPPWFLILTTRLTSEMILCGVGPWCLSAILPHRFPVSVTFRRLWGKLQQTFSAPDVPAASQAAAAISHTKTKKKAGPCTIFILAIYHASLMSPCCYLQTRPNQPVNDESSVMKQITRNWLRPIHPNTESSNTKKTSVMEEIT